MLKEHFTEVILRTVCVSVFQCLAWQVMELSTLAAWLPDQTLKCELQSEELNLCPITKPVKDCSTVVLPGAHENVMSRPDVFNLLFLT